MHPFIKGFINQGLSKGMTQSQLIPMAKKAFDLLTPDSIFDAVKGSHNTKEEIISLLKHTGAHGIPTGLMGAGLGAAFAKDKKKGALLGGATGFGAGALADAYSLGENGKHQFTDDMSKAQNHASHDVKNLNFKQNLDSANNNLDVAKNSKWFDYYYPPRILENLR